MNFLDTKHNVVADTKQNVNANIKHSGIVGNAMVRRCPFYCIVNEDDVLRNIHGDYTSGPSFFDCAERKYALEHKWAQEISDNVDSICGSVIYDKADLLRLRIPINDTMKLVVYSIASLNQWIDTKRKQTWDREDEDIDPSFFPSPIIILDVFTQQIIPYGILARLEWQQEKHRIEFEQALDDGEYDVALIYLRAIDQYMLPVDSLKMSCWFQRLLPDRKCPQYIKEHLFRLTSTEFKTLFINQIFETNNHAFLKDVLLKSEYISFQKQLEYSDILFKQLETMNEYDILYNDASVFAKIEMFLTIWNYNEELVASTIVQELNTTQDNKCDKCGKCETIKNVKLLDSYTSFVAFLKRDYGMQFASTTPTSDLTSTSTPAQAPTLEMTDIVDKNDNHDIYDERLIPLCEMAAVFEDSKSFNTLSIIHRAPTIHPAVMNAARLALRIFNIRNLYTVSAFHSNTSNDTKDRKSNDMKDIKDVKSNETKDMKNGKGNLPRYTHMLYLETWTMKSMTLIRYFILRLEKLMASHKRASAIRNGVMNYKTGELTLGNNNDTALPWTSLVFFQHVLIMASDYMKRANVMVLNATLLDFINPSLWEELNKIDDLPYERIMDLVLVFQNTQAYEHQQQQKQSNSKSKPGEPESNSRLEEYIVEQCSTLQTMETIFKLFDNAVTGEMAENVVNALVSLLMWVFHEELADSETFASLLKHIKTLNFIQVQWGILIARMVPHLKPTRKTAQIKTILDKLNLSTLELNEAIAMLKNNTDLHHATRQNIIQELKTIHKGKNKQDTARQ